MVTQLSLAVDDPIGGGVRRSDPISSVAGARAVDAESQCARIHDALVQAGRALTVAQLVELTGIPRDEVASRLPVMRRKGLAAKAGMVTNARGRPVQAWVAT